MRVQIDAPGVDLQLRDSRGDLRSASYDENLVASNNVDFIPYIPGSIYSPEGSTTVVTVGEPLSNTDRYTVEVIGTQAAAYNIVIQTLQDDRVMTSTTISSSVARGQTQAIPLQLKAVNGTLDMTVGLPTTIARLQSTVAYADLHADPGTVAQTSLELTAAGQQSVRDIIVEASDLMGTSGLLIGKNILSMSLSGNAMDSGAKQSIQVRADLAGVPVGLYFGSLTVTSTGAGPVTIPVMLRVGTLPTSEEPKSAKIYVPLANR